MNGKNILIGLIDNFNKYSPKKSNDENSSEVDEFNNAWNFGDKE